MMQCVKCNAEMMETGTDIFADYGLLRYECPECNHRASVIEWEETDKESDWHLVNSKDTDSLYMFFDDVDSEIKDYYYEDFNNGYNDGFEDGKSYQKHGRE